MQLRFAFYGDDFTGSTDAMEALQWAGVPTLLFLAPPNRQQLDAFGSFEAVGVAGNSRTMSPSAMERELIPALKHLRDLGARLVHYKTCSTFDSSPEIGSIGKAIEIGRDVFASKVVPVMVGAPDLGRYQVFGNLFARSGLDTEPYRLDRHPTMKHHPITPMNESDVRVHLAAQTQLRIGLCDILSLQDRQSCERICFDPDSNDVLLFDVLYPEHLARIGSILERMSNAGPPLFVVGSSGIEYAMTAYWRSNLAGRLLSEETRHLPTFGAVEQLVVVTGSCSPVTDRQIAWAERNGFEALSVDASRLIDEQTSLRELESTVDRALQRLRRGANLILHTSRGPSDPRILATLQAMQKMGLSQLEIKLQSGRLLGPKLGKLLKGILSERSLSRVGIAGGDTSGFIARELGLMALEAIAPVAPGAPLCRAHAQNSLEGVEFFFKGGQVGKEEVWGTLLNGSHSIPIQNTCL